MYSIAGNIALNEDLSKNEKIFANMRNSMQQCENKQHGINIGQHFAFVHTGHSVIDAQNRNQPMTVNDENSEYTIVYSGKLYNKEEIRKQLVISNVKFSGQSDTEIVLKAYIKWKEKCLDKFNGVFAFAIWDKKNERLFIARDRVGVKPLFYYHNKDEFIFASEIKGLFASGKVKSEITTDSIAEIMLIGPGRTQGYGVFKGVKELLPAHYAYYDQNGLTIRKYWHVRSREHTDNLEQTIEKVNFLVTDAIERQLSSDEPLGTFLSGGLDSSILSSIANKHFNLLSKKLYTFSVDYVDNDKYFKESRFQPNRDNEYIKIMNDYLGAEHHNIVLDTPALAQALKDAVDARDLPGMADIDSSLLLFSKEVKEYCSVALSGECADEIFGGYPWYRDKHIRMVEGFPWAQSTSYRHSFLTDEFANDIDAENYVLSRYQMTLDDTDKSGNCSDVDKRMKEMMRLNLDWFMQTLLQRGDRMSLHSGLELRVPFCDYRIIEYLYNVPWEYKDYNHYEKGLLRKAMEDYVPHEILWRKKSPYPKTHNPAYLKAVSSMLQEIIDDDTSPIFDFIKKSELQRLLTDMKSEPWYGQLMTTPQTIAYFVQINYWLKKYHVRIV